jgi:hypothetical protein
MYLNLHCIFLNLHYVFLNLHYIYLNLHSRIFKSTFNVYLILHLGKKSQTRKKIRDKYAIYISNEISLCIILIFRIFVT